MKLGTLIRYLKKIQKIYKSRDKSFAFCWHQHFRNSKFCYIEKYRYRLYFDTLSLILLIFFESWKIFLINMVTILMMSAKMATLGLFKIKVFLNKCYDVIISVYDVINKNFSCDSNYIIDVMWPKFGNPRLVEVTSEKLVGGHFCPILNRVNGPVVLKRFHMKKHIFCMLLVLTRHPHHLKFVLNTLNSLLNKFIWILDAVSFHKSTVSLISRDILISKE